MYAYRLVFAALLLFVGCTMVPATSAEAAACTLQKQDLPSISYLELTRVDGLVVHLQRSNYNYSPTALVWQNYQYQGQYYIPFE